MFAKALVIVLAVPLFAQFVSADCTRTYTVRPGDICDGISAAQNVSTYQLAVVNPSIDPHCDNLQPDSTLCLGLAGEDCTSTYVVRLGDTCDDITYNSNINSTIFWQNNPQLDDECTNLYVGEVVCTAGTVMVPPPPGNGYMPGSAIPATSTPAPSDLPYCDEM